MSGTLHAGLTSITWLCPGCPLSTQELRLSLNQDSADAAAADEGHCAGGNLGAGAHDETSPVRRRLAAQGLTSPPTAEKLNGVTERQAAGPLRSFGDARTYHVAVTVVGKRR